MSPWPTARLARTRPSGPPGSSLTNVHFNDADGDTTLTIAFTAASGFDVILHSFDLASFFSGGQNLAGMAVYRNLEVAPV